MCKGQLRKEFGELGYIVMDPGFIPADSLLLVSDH
jgi:hypothetical protein